MGACHAIATRRGAAPPPGPRARPPRGPGGARPPPRAPPREPVDEPRLLRDPALLEDLRADARFEGLMHAAHPRVRSAVDMEAGGAGPRPRPPGGARAAPRGAR